VLGQRGGRQAHRPGQPGAEGPKQGDGGGGTGGSSVRTGRAHHQGTGRRIVGLAQTAASARVARTHEARCSSPEAAVSTGRWRPGETPDMELTRSSTRHANHGNHHADSTSARLRLRFRDYVVDGFQFDPGRRCRCRCQQFKLAGGGRRGWTGRRKRASRSSPPGGECTRRLHARGRNMGMSGIEWETCRRVDFRFPGRGADLPLRVRDGPRCSAAGNESVHKLRACGRVREHPRQRRPPGGRWREATQSTTAAPSVGPQGGARASGIGRFGVSPVGAASSAGRVRLKRVVLGGSPGPRRFCKKTRRRHRRPAGPGRRGAHCRSLRPVIVQQPGGRDRRWVQGPKESGRSQPRKKWAGATHNWPLGPRLGQLPGCSKATWPNGWVGVAVTGQPGDRR